MQRGDCHVVMLTRPGPTETWPTTFKEVLQTDEYTTLTILMAIFQVDLG